MGKTRRLTLAGSGTAVAYTASYLVLNKTWYRQFARSSFHLFDDGAEWLQVDKLGHGYSAYQLSRLAYPAWQWAGLSQPQALVAATAGSMFYLSGIEWMDAHSQKWGWSWTDIAANTAGVLLFAGQQWAWEEQRVQLKFSVWPTRYAPDVATRAAQLFGDTRAERVLKDYNTQTYWLSLNLYSVVKAKALPRWMNLALGYGADGMFGGFSNEAFDKWGNRFFYRPDIQRARQWYLSPDIDFTRIKTGRKGLRTLLYALNCLKLPMPGLRLEKGKIKGGLF